MDRPNTDTYSPSCRGAAGNEATKLPSGAVYCTQPATVEGGAVVLGVVFKGTAPIGGGAFGSATVAKPALGRSALPILTTTTPRRAMTRTPAPISRGSFERTPPPAM